MTNEEAIEIIKYASAFNNENSILTKALEIAIKALEKQEPRKPEDFYICGKHLCIGSCPICGEDINDEFSYCFNCGQKLDWGEENA